MLPYFQRLGERIERAWLAHSYNEEIFPRLVLGELEREPPHRQVEVAEIIDWVFGPSQEFRQPNNELFGEPPIMLFQAPRFYIEALFWFSGTPGIHEHGFSGAFAVLAGSSVQSHWSFTPERTINSRMLCGRLERVETQILRPGSMQPIYSGSRLIHQLFHLETPSVTIVVRTYVDRDHLPERGYLLPGLALDSEGRDSLRLRRLIFLEHMARGQLGGLREYSRRILESGDLETIYHVFSTLTLKNVESALLDELYGVARERHGEVINLFQEVCRLERRTRNVVFLRSKVLDPEVRFLLALLMLMPDRDAIFETIGLQFPGIDALQAIEAWLASISGRGTIGFEFHDLNRLIFRSLVKGLDKEELLQQVQAEHSIAVDPEELLENARKMASSVLFHSLFSNSPLRGVAIG